MALFLLFVITAVVGNLAWRMEVRRRESEHEQTDFLAYAARAASDPENCAAQESMGDWLVRHQRLREARDAYILAAHIEEQYDSDIRGEGRLRYKINAIDRDIDAGSRTNNSIIFQPFGPKNWEVEFCRNCGTSNDPEAAKCEYCGDTMPARTMAESMQRMWNNKITRWALIEMTIIIAVLYVTVLVVHSLSVVASAMVLCAGAIVLGFIFIQSFNGNRG